MDALYGETEGWRALPLAAKGPNGVPLDVWRDRPRSHLAPVPRDGLLRVEADDAVGHRIWVALRSQGAYPRSAYGTDAATLRVIYADQSPGPEARLPDRSARRACGRV